MSLGLHQGRAAVLSAACAAALIGSGSARAGDVRSYTDSQGVVHLYNGHRHQGTAARGPSGISVSTLLIEAEAAEAGKFYNIPPALIKAVIAVESNYNQWAVSQKGAIGLMQLMPKTAREMYVDDPYDWQENIWGGTRYLRILLNRFGDGDLFKVLAAYNAGPDLVDRSASGGGLGVPAIPETQDYVRRVLRAYKAFQAQAQAQPPADHG